MTLNMTLIVCTSKDTNKKMKTTLREEEIFTKSWKIKANYNKINTSHSLECLFKNKNKTNKRWWGYRETGILI